MGKRPHTNTIGGLPSLLRPPNTAMPGTRGLTTGTYIKQSFPYLNLVVIHVAASQRTRSMSWDPNTPLPPNRRHQSSTQPTSLPATHKRREDFRHALVRMIMYVLSYIYNTTYIHGTVLSSSYRQYPDEESEESGDTTEKNVLVSITISRIRPPFYFVNFLVALPLLYSKRHRY